MSYEVSLISLPRSRERTVVMRSRLRGEDWSESLELHQRA
jgi:hypothetical protein